MTILEEGLIAYLKSYAGLTALISSRVHMVNIPDVGGEIKIPCVVVNRVSTPYTHTMDSSGATGTLTSPRFQFDAWASTASSAKAIQDQLRAALNGKTGSTGAGAVTVTIRAALAENERLDRDPLTRLFHGISEFFVWFEE